MVDVARWIKGYKESKSEVSQTIDLKKYLGDSFSNEALENKIGQELVDRMKKRTLDNKNILGKAFKPSRYSEEYTDSLEFKAAGKSKSDVNIRLSGNTLESMTVEPIGSGKIKLTFDDSDVMPLVYAHQTGYKGHPTIPNGKYQRPFFGVLEKDIKEVADKYKDQVKEERSKRTQRTLDVLDEVQNRSRLDQFFDRILNRNDGEE